MDYLNDLIYNNNATIMKNKFVFEVLVYVKSFIFMKMWTQTWIRRFSGIRVKAYHFLFQLYLHKLCNGIIKYLLI